MVRDDLFGQHQIGLQQRLGGAFHRDAGHAAHLSQLRGQGVELLVVGGPHVSTLRSDGNQGHDATGELAVNGRESLSLFAADVGAVGDAEILRQWGGCGVDVVRQVHLH